jgi:putative transposase
MTTACAPANTGDVAAYIRYNNLDRDHAANGELSLVCYEQMVEKKASIMH